MNWCDHGHETAREVRLLPLDDRASGANLWVCRRHYEQEMATRRASGNDERKVREWESLERRPAEKRLPSSYNQAISGWSAKD